jgi:hypothetical protein
MEPILGRPFCGLTQNQLEGVGAINKWGHAPVTMSHNMDLRVANISTSQIDDIFVRVGALWSSTCGIDLVYIGAGQTANIFAESGRIDNRNGILGQSYLPFPGIPRSYVIGQLYDTAEAWTVDFLFKVVLHEVGHAIGLDHGPQGTAIMSPMLTSLAAPQAWDINQTQARYGPPRTIPVPTPGPDPAPDPTTPEISIFKKKVVTVPFGGIINVPKPGRWLLRVDSGPRKATVTLSLTDRPN